MEKTRNSSLNRAGPKMLSTLQARYQALASCGAILIAYLGLVHELVGAQLFPWAPALLQGPVGWHGAGIAMIVIGVSLLAGTLRLAKVPIIFLCALAGTFALGISVIAPLIFHQFHFGSTTIVIAAMTTAIFDRKSRSMEK